VHARLSRSRPCRLSSCLREFPKPKTKQTERTSGSRNPETPGQSAEGRNHSRRGHAGGPHECGGLRANSFERFSVCTPKKGRCSKTQRSPTGHPRDCRSLAFDNEEETNSYCTPEQPVCDRMRREIEKNPAHDHCCDSDSCRARRTGYCYCEAGKQDSQCLKEISGRYRQPRKHFAFRDRVVRSSGYHLANCTRSSEGSRSGRLRSR
jgi:hypothetical protein